MTSGKTAGKRKLAEGAPLKIAGTFINDVLQAPSSAMSLVGAIGESDTGSFLVPFAYLSLFEAVDGKANELLGAFVPLESAAYLIADLTSELQASVGNLEDLAKLPLEPSRLKAMRDYVLHAREALDGVADELERLAAAPGK
jgi:hypothetical protein